MQDRRPQVLIVDDDPVNRMLLSRMMQREGYTTVEAVNGREGLAYLETSAVDMVFLDIEMPEATGFDVLRGIRSTPRTADLPVVMVSGLDDMDSVVRAIELGADDYVTKPISRTLLQARSRAILERKYLRDREFARMRSMLCRFVPEKVADDLLADPDGSQWLEGRKGVVTVMFGDLRSFTTWAEQSTPEAVTGVLNTYLGAMSDVILDYGGTLVSYMGDGFMAVFGAPVTNDHHADLALAAARSMACDALGEFNRWVTQSGYGPGFRMGIGLNSGLVMAGNVGSQRRIEYTVVGDTVNTAARIEQATKDHSRAILISDATRAALAAMPPDLEPVGEITLRGKANPTTLWTVG
ncbi:adenylate/guanylate cyclase domain-containing protein [Kitasatospora sp. NPDC048540]|uniref:adenylate/guanylate cyclase domain-containing protein n=1 Tax=unclassified Kitasatospora TaxID=2633591 RepID=UPI00053ACE55|nr:adenylate/guanylate cyclase domain-containing protein [Kitasatospora sp. MBT63]